MGTPVEPFSEELFRQFYRTGSRVEYEAVYFQTRRRLCAFTALSLWEEDERWLAELEKALRALLAEPTWALPAHVPEDADETARRETLDLFACETARRLRKSSVCWKTGLTRRWFRRWTRRFLRAPCVPARRRKGAGAHRTGRPCVRAAC